jgi:hypothetical protein
MYSLNNFYSILYSNLLKPSKFIFEYFYPFGSINPSDIISTAWISPIESEEFGYTSRPYCLAYDQEPLNSNLNDLGRWFVSPTRLSLFANSEKSEVKSKYCRDYGYMNWYYFFHGFAAADWYRDAKYFNIETDNFTSPFMSLNRLNLGDRSYRLYLVSKLKDKNLLSKGLVSLHLNNDDWKKELISPSFQMSKNARFTVYHSLKNQTDPIIADKRHAVGWDSANYDYSSFLFNKSAFWHSVSETVFYYDKLHLTEKIFKPIVHKRPFMLVGSVGNLEYIKSYGFQTFDKWIDEGYDTITNHEERIDAIVEQLNKICSMSIDDLVKMKNEMQEVLDFNFNHFFGKFRYIISKELVDNFKACITTWNQNQRRGVVNIDHCDFERTIQLLSN